MPVLKQLNIELLKQLNIELLKQLEFLLDGFNLDYDNSLNNNFRKNFFRLTSADHIPQN